MKLFIGNLSAQTTQKQLENLFTEFGDIRSAVIVTDNYTRRPRGFAFVEMDSKECAEKAIQKLNNTSVHGQSIVVNEAKEKTSGGGRSYSDRKNFNSSY